MFVLASCKDDQSSDKLDLYLCIGQSNMSGRAEITRAYSDTLENVYILTNDSMAVWEKAANPFNKYSTIRKKIEMQKFGPCYSFAKKMQEYYPSKKIGLIVNARGGTSIDLWQKDGEYFNEAVRRTKIAMKDGELKGILWCQGGSDYDTWQTYMPRLKTFVNDLRFALGDSNIPVVVRELSTDKPGRRPFNTMLANTPAEIANTAVVKSDGTSTFDSIHFDTKSQVLTGERFADKMYPLLKLNKQ